MELPDYISVARIPDFVKGGFCFSGVNFDVPGHTPADGDLASGHPQEQGASAAGLDDLETDSRGEAELRKAAADFPAPNDGREGQRFS